MRNWGRWGVSSPRQFKARLWQHIRIPSMDDCWEWQGSLLKDGYAKIWRGRKGINGKQYKVHRLIYKLLVGPIPSGLELDHLCRNRSCVNPYHLEPVTKSENIRRGLAPEIMRNFWQSKTHCPNGHPYDLINTYFSKKGRDCRACRQRRTQEYNKRRQKIG